MEGPNDRLKLEVVTFFRLGSFHEDFWIELDK